MSGLTTFQLVDTGVHLFPALVWGIVARHSWRFLHTRHPRSRFFRLLPMVGGLTAFTYLVFTVIALIPAGLRQQHAGGVLLLYALNYWTMFTIVALARHMSRYFPTPEEPPPGWAWMLVNYGSSAVMNVLAAVFLGLVHVPYLSPQFGPYPAMRMAYQLVMLGFTVW